MATANSKTPCATCKKVSRTFNCEGCTQGFCFDCLTKHLQELKKDLNSVDTEHEQFRQKLTEQKKDTKKRSLIQQVDQWEEDAINKIKQTAQNCRQRLINYRTRFLVNLENQLNNMTKQIKQFNQDSQFNETDLNDLKSKLKYLKEELDKPPNVTIQLQPTTFIDKILTIIPFEKETKWKRQGISVAGGNGKGDQSNQLYGPQCLCIDNDQTIYIADCLNNRIVEWKSNATRGDVAAGGNGKGSQLNQLDRPGDLIYEKDTNSLIISDLENRRIVRWTKQNNPTGQVLIKDVDCDGITMDRNGFIYVSDPKKHEVRRWKIGDKTGTIVAGGNGPGSDLNQLNYPTCVFIDQDSSLYVSDCLNHRIVKWVKDAKEGIVVAGGNDQGFNLSQLHCPQGVVVDQLGQIYISDWGNHRIMRWSDDSKEGTIIAGGNDQGDQPDQLNCPIGISFDIQGNLYVADFENNRVQKFEVE